jgi:predicted RNA-binding Zn-ribbon protein involved in translation (DUF1610 family)
MAPVRIQIQQEDSVMPGQLVEIHATWEAPYFRCPACGKAVFLETGLTDYPCPHLLFRTGT